MAIQPGDALVQPQHPGDARTSDQSEATKQNEGDVSADQSDGAQTATVPHAEQVAQPTELQSS